MDFILSPREHHAVRDAAEYERKHAAAIAEKARAGMRFTVREVPTPAVAYVSAGSWVIQCECGAGNATDPSWGMACCFGCGAVHRQVRFPKDVAAIEAALVERPVVASRHWLPGETPQDLALQNAVMREARERGRR